VTIVDTNRSSTISTSRPPLVVGLDDERASDSHLTGAKASNLARARVAGLPVLPGFVLTTAFDGADLEVARDRWWRLSGDGHDAIVVRSSSTGEDGSESSMAGMFESVLDVLRWDGFAAAVATVRRSAHVLVDAPMAVLVQRQLDARFGGVLFGADPISGRSDRLVVSAVDGGPDRLVSGLQVGWTAALTPRGRVVEVRADDGPRLSADLLRRLARLARDVAATFGGPQDVEWAVDAQGALWLLQARPITTLHGPVGGPVFGPGPVAETFPDPLAPLEQDLWLAPLRDGLAEALALTGTASQRALGRSPLVIAPGGRAAVDLRLLGVVKGRGGFLRRLDPRPPARRLRAAWRVGRLTRALPALARDVVEQVDDDLAEVPPVDELSNQELVAVLDNGRVALTALHGYEALAGLLVPDSTASVTAASIALCAVAQARDEGVHIDDLIEHDPRVLALLPPRIGSVADFASLVSEAICVIPPADADIDAAAVAREALRLRTRWVQELTARAASELARRLVAIGVLPDDAAARLLTLNELRTAVQVRIVPPDLAEREEPAGRPLPAHFRLAADGTPTARVERSSRGNGAPAGAVGAGGGVGRGPVHIGSEPPAGAVLVVPHLDPRLAGVVGRLGGLVAETGSPLSHLAILAREHGVPTVVGHAGATEGLRQGEIVEVDGAAGTVRRLEAPASADVSTPDGGAAISSPVRSAQPERELVLEEIGVRP
jgi:pyruvate,water dikinase